MRMRHRQLKRLWLPNTYVGYDEQLVLDLICGYSQVQLGTVDIFQGREAKIVIVSLVRNSGEFDPSNAKIGFLKVTVTL